MKRSLHTFSALLREPPPAASLQPTHAANISALAAAAIACGIPLISGMLGGWPWARIGAYVLLTALYCVLMVRCLWGDVRRSWANQPLWLYLIVFWLLSVALQAISGDWSVQPIVFTIPFVQAALTYAPWRAFLVGAAYLAGMALGIWLGGGDPLSSVATYGALLGFMFAFVRLSTEQTRARAHADALAAELGRERDNFALLAAATATLTRDLDVHAVLAEVAAAGQQLAHAHHAQAWLHDAADDPLDPAPVVEARRLVVPLLFNGQPVGVLALESTPDAPFSPEHARLLQPLADAAAAAITNAQLFAQAQHAATLAERNRLARELHDTIAQGLTAVTMQLEAAGRSFDRDAERTRSRVTRAHELARQALDDVRRSVWTLAEPLVDDRELVISLGRLGQQWSAHSGTALHYEHAGEAVPVGSAAATQVLRIVREALHNVEKHARASHVVLLSASTDTAFQISVRDDGVGFTPGATGNTDDAHGFGLRSLHERARLAGGTVAIASAPGAGTCITLTIPNRVPLIIDD